MPVLGRVLVMWFLNLWSSIVEWAWVLLALASAASFIVSAFASLIPFLRSYGGAALIVGIVLAVASANIQGRASSSARARLVETQRQLTEAQRANARQVLVIEGHKRAAAAADEAIMKMAADLQARDDEATNLELKIIELEKSDATFSDWADGSLPSGLGGLLK